MITILVVDDHPVVRRGVRQILAEDPDLVVGGEARDGQEARHLVRARDWDVVLLDLSLPDQSGLEVLKDLRKQYPRLPVLVLSMHSEEQFAVRALKAGAAGYLTKESAPQDLVEAIHKVVNGGKHVSATLAERLAADLGSATDLPPHERLSDREYQVLRLIASGKTVGQIASQLSLSVKTISTYRSRILEKMHMKTNAELTHYALRNRVVE